MTKRTKIPDKNPKTSSTKDTTDKRNHDLQTDKSIHDWRNPDQQFNGWLQDLAPFGETSS